MEGFAKADRVRLWRYSVPLVEKVSLRKDKEISVREGVIVEALRDGASHFGEVAPLPGLSRETLPEALEQLRHLLATAPDLDLSTGSVFRGLLLPSVDFAVWSVLASIRDQPLRRVPLAGLLDGGQDAMVSNAVGLSRRGYRTLKLKVGRRGVSEDAGTVLRIAAATGDGVRLRLDANRAWSVSEAVEFASLTESASRRIEFVEEPLAEAHPASLGMLSEEVGMPVALDESLAGAEPGMLDSGVYSFVQAVVLKPQILGAARSLAFARRASLLGADVVVSASYESGVGILGLLRFAGECAAETPPAAGLDTYRRLREDTLLERLDLSGPTFDGAKPPKPELRTAALERLL
ncbi:o-succinylbenzoate synthase [Rubrobacter indicoceani]|uniref:o-succinylbenzoate synthase n=1 Tax=Rubrobacter indicoceani TaxID=2051957 RepID=UPI0013C47AE3|nr:o-succinylbenzoate synthase [Rubrobacter indicoceani]